MPAPTYYEKLNINAAAVNATTAGLTTLGGTTASITASTLVLSGGGGGMQVDASNLAGQQYGGETAIIARKAVGLQAQQLRIYSRYRPNAGYFYGVWNVGYVAGNTATGGAFQLVHTGGGNFSTPPIGNFHELSNKSYQYEQYTEGTGASTVVTIKLYNATDSVYETWLSSADVISSAGEYAVTVLDTNKTARIALPGSVSTYGLTAVLGEGGAINLTNFVYSDAVPNTANPPISVGNPVASLITATTARLTIAPTGGTGTFTEYWERKTNDTNGVFVDATLPSAVEVNLVLLASAAYHNYRVTVSDGVSTPVTVGVRFQTLPLQTELSAYTQYEFIAPNLARLTMVPSGGDGNYSAVWANPGGDSGITRNPATLNSLTLELTCSDTEIQHVCPVHIVDGGGLQWTLNDTGYPTFSFPTRPQLRKNDTVLYPTATTPVALPAGFIWRQQGDSTSQASVGGQSTSFYVAQALNAAKNITTVSADFYNSSYGGTTAAALTNAANTAAYLNANSVTDYTIRLAYNDNTAGITAAQSNANIRDLIAYIAANATTVQRIWVLPTTFRNSGPVDWGDGGEARLRSLQTLLSPIHDTIISGKKVYFGSALPYDMSQADPSIYTTDRYTHYADAGAQAIGAYDANSVLSVFPVAANAPITGLAAGATRRFAFPVAGTLAGQVVTWAVVRTGGGGAAYGTLSSSGLYTAPSPLPTTAGAADTISGTAANGASTSVVVQLVVQAGTVATPTYSPGAGTFTAAQAVALACATAGAAIHYTTDGTTPTAASPAYTVPLTVSTTQTIKALAVNAGMTDSAVASALFTINSAFAPPAGVTATAGVERIALAWTPNSDAVYTEVRATSGGALLAVLFGNNGTVWGLTSGVAYALKLKHISAAGAASGETTAPAATPTAPGSSGGVTTLLVKGPLALTPDSLGSDGTELLFVGDNPLLRLHLTDGAGNIVPVGGGTLTATTIDNATGAVVSNGVGLTVVSDEEGLVTYAVQPADTTTPRRLRLTVRRTANGQTQTFGPLILRVLAR